MFDWLSELIAGMLDYIYNLMPVDAFINAFQTINGLMPPIVLYLLHLSAADVVFPMIIGAHVTKFVIRRIPFIG